jgi:protein-S-isoprenylcysteine O-methyltransferase Ste14
MTQVNPAPIPPAAPRREAEPRRALDFVFDTPTGWYGVLGFFVGVGCINAVQAKWPRASLALIVMALTATPMLICDYLVLRRMASQGPVDGFTPHGQASWRRVGVKFLGLLGTLAILAFFYWLFPEYQNSFRPGAFYWNYFATAVQVGPFALLLTPLYFRLVDGRMADPHDGYWHMGQVFLLRWREVDWDRVAKHARVWAVKGFFLPLMFSYVCSNAAGLAWTRELGESLRAVLASPSTAGADFIKLHNYANNMIFSVDLVFVSCGYLLTLRFFQSHVRSAEPTALGWVSALICYQPFWKLIGDQYLGYWSDTSWDVHLTQGSLGFYLCGLAVLFFEAAFAWATIVFGLRFSNLTHRGIVRSGPYALTKHPAYITKIAAFFFINLPWADTRGIDRILHNFLLLAGLALVYTIRAKTEERHLASIDPTYAVYAEEIAARHRRWFAFLLGRPRTS